jgi:hypothetical protein
VAGQCVQCDTGSTLTLVNNTFNDAICIDSNLVVAGCLRYSNIDNSICETCETGQTFDDITRVCPGSSSNNAGNSISSCAQVQIQGNLVKCIRCNAGFDLDFQLNRCVANVMFCSQYSEETARCSRCITGYNLDTVNNVCNRVV